MRVNRRLEKRADMDRVGSEALERHEVSIAKPAAGRCGIRDVCL